MAEKPAKVEMDPDTSISFDLSLAASQEFCQRRKRVLDNMSNVSLLTTKSFGVNETIKSTRCSSSKSIEWEEKLMALAEVIRSVDEVNCAEQVNETLEGRFKELRMVLCQTVNSKRPQCTFDLITTFAVAVVKLQQWYCINGYNRSDELLTVLIHKTLEYWLNARKHFNDMDRAWNHTRSVIIAILRNIRTLRTLISVKHLISSMIIELLSYVAKDEDYAYGLYASEQLEYFQTVLTEQFRNIQNSEFECMDDYEKIAVVGRGAHGVCWLCRRKDDVFRQTVIVKTVSLDGLTPEEETAIMGEVTLLQRLHHPHIIGYYESFKTENALSIVMQYAEGGTMDKMISDQKGVFFSEQQVLSYFTQVAIGLEYMHSKQILHRDLKTQNILLNKKRTIVKLSDFGISKELSTRSLASTVVGTPNYLSPEICEGRAYNQKSDLWALGCVLYELCELKRAFDGENLPSIVMKITRGKHGSISDHWSADLKRLIESLLDLNENNRPLLKEILTCPLVLPVCMSIHLDLGQLPAAPSRKGRPMGTSNSKVLRTKPVRTRSQIGSVE